MKSSVFAKTLLLLVLILSLTLFFAACGKEQDETSAEESGVHETTAETTVETTVAGEETTVETTAEAEQKQSPAVGNPSAIGASSSESDSLPILYINTENEQPILSRDEYINATVSTDGTTDDEVYGFKDLTAEVRCRGNYTYTGTEKKSYRLKFTEKINLFGQGYGPAKSWVLLANHCDQTFLRNHIAFTVGRNLSNIEYTSSSSFVKLYVNGEYYGIYQVAEQHQVNVYRVNVNEDVNSVDTDYFIERDYYADETCTYGVDYFTVKDHDYRVHSDYMTKEKCAFLQAFFEDAHEAIADGDKQEVEQYIDLASFVDTFILQAFVKNTDVGYSSFFMVKKAGDVIYFTCPWDFDNALGNDERLDNGSYEGLYVGVKTGMFQQHEWFYLLMNNEWFCDMVRERWNEVKTTLYDAVISEIERINLCFGDDMKTNFDVWMIFGRQINQEPSAIRSLRSYASHVNYLEKWVKGRYRYLDTLINSDAWYSQGGTEDSWGGGGWKPWW